MIQDLVKIDDNDENLIVLKETIDEMSNILDLISDNASQMIQMELVKGKTYLIQGQVLDSAGHTLLSILGCSQRACFSDAFTLVRKFRDDLLQYLFIIFTLNGIKGLTDEEAKYYIGDFTDINKIIEGISLSMEILSSGSKKNPREKAMDLWLENTLSDDTHSQERKQYFDASKYIAFLKTDETINRCFELYLKSSWSTIDRRLNNYVHANGSKYIMANLPNFIYRHRKNMLRQLVSTTRGIMVIFISLLILIKPTLIQSSDYIDYLDMGQTPPEGSQYWIGPIFQNFIDTDIVRESSDLKQFLKDNNRYNMQIE